MKHRDVLEMIEAGGNVYYLAKLAGIFGLNVQEIGAQQTGMTSKRSRRCCRRRGARHGTDRRRRRDVARSFDRQRHRRGLHHDPYWKPFFDGLAGVHKWLADVKPDVAVVIYNDHGLNFFLDKMPTFAVGAASEYRNADEGWGLPVSRPFPGDAALSWHIIESLVADEFDVTTCQEMLVDHAFTVPMALLWPGTDNRPVRTIPIAINTVQHPLPTPARCYKFGQAVGRGPAILKVCFC